MIEGHHVRDFEAAAESGDYFCAAVAYIAYHDHVSIAELQRFFSAYVETRGRVQLDVHEIPNLVVWSGMSEEFAEVLEKCLASSLLERRQTDPLVYMIDGAMQSLPLAVRPPKNGYKEPHWVPLIFRPRREEPAG